MVGKKLVSSGILIAMALTIGIFGYKLNYEMSQSQMNQSQTKFCLYTEEGSSGIARLRYTQNLTIALLSDTEFEIVYTAKTAEDLHEERAELILSSGLVQVDGTMRWEGDLDPDELLTLKATARVSEDGRFRVRGTIGFSFSDSPQIEHADLYVVVENGRIVDVTLDSGEKAPTPEQAAEEIKP